MRANSPNPIHDERSASKYLGVTPSCLRRWRRVGVGPVWVRVGRLVRYRQSSLESFIETNTMQPPIEERPNEVVALEGEPDGRSDR